MLFKERMMKKKDQYLLNNKAGYTAISCRRVGRGGNTRFPTFQLERSTNQPTDRPTDGRTKPFIELRVRNKKTILERVTFADFWQNNSSSGKSVRWSVRNHRGKTHITAPAHPSATDGRVSGLVLSKKIQHLKILESKRVLFPSCNRHFSKSTQLWH